MTAQDTSDVNAPKFDAVHHPRHYNAHPSGVECIDIAELLSFNLGNCLKYCWRAGMKGNEKEDLDKALWYLERENARLCWLTNAERSEEVNRSFRHVRLATLMLRLEPFKESSDFAALVATNMLQAHGHHIFSQSYDNIRALITGRLASLTGSP